MILTDFYHKNDDQIHISRQQASRFAKEVANDFNPLHDADAKMFCVPGDLLFSVALEHLGLSQQMSFTFSGMVTDAAVIFPETDTDSIDIADAEGKRYLSIERSGEISRDPALINHLAADYVAFSGKTFPHILVPLMSDQGMMINPARPLVIYQKMELSLDRLDLTAPTLEAADSDFQVIGKKGTVKLAFSIKDQGETLGHGAKHMSLRGLQPYDEAAMSRLVEEYDQYRDNYQSPV
jgi:hypothetical protein